MKQFKEFLNHIDWKEFAWSMGIFFVFFIIITIGMVVTGTWGVFGKEMGMFLGFGFVLSIGINIIKQLK